MIAKGTKQEKRFIQIILIVLIALFTLICVNKAISPMFDTLVCERAKGVATEILNSESNKLLGNLNYEDLVKVVTDKDENINLLKMNVIEMNMLASDVAYNIQKELNNLERDVIAVPIGALFR